MPQIKSKHRIGIKTLWRDTIIRADGSRETGEWRENQMQDTAAILVAAFLRQWGEDPSFPNPLPVDPINNEFVSADWEGIQFIALGSGSHTWDALPGGIPPMPESDTTLTDEFYRKELSSVDMMFLDAGTGAPSAVPTRRFKIAITFLPGEANGDLREFALFGGNCEKVIATGDPVLDSGVMYNWITHPLISKDATITLTREIDITVIPPGLV